jgi:type IV pilus assembly protein PilA
MKGAIAFFLVLLAVFFLYTRRKHIEAGEADAQGALQAINAAEQAYITHYPELGYTCSLLSLGPQKHGRPSAAAADFLDPELARGMKDGYRFTVDHCHTNSLGITDGYQVRAEPRFRGWDGQRAYCTDGTGLVRPCEQQRQN